MAGPLVRVYQAVDETGESYARMREAGIALDMPDGPGAAAAYRPGGPEELVFAPETVAGIGVSNRAKRITRRSLESAAGLRLIAKYSIGYDNVDVDAATELGIAVTHSPTESNWGGVAEGAMALLLALLKKVRERDRHVKDGGWRDPALEGTYLGARRTDGYEGICVGIVGLGRIGARLADLLAPWRVRLVACDPHVEEARFVHHDVRRVGLETLLREADVVTIHCNLSAETESLVGAREFGLMKPDAVLVNTARGPIVDADALFDALEGGRIAGAALDVLPEEPPDPQTPLLGLGDKLILSPHMVSANRGTGLRMAVPWVERAVHAALRGEVPEHVVNPDALPRWRERFGGRNLLQPPTERTAR